MTAERERALLARAEELEDTSDLTEDVTEALGSARGARLDPDALTNLAQTALVLGADTVTVYRAAGSAFLADTDMAEAVDECEDAIADRAAVVRRELDEAEAALRDAREALAGAKADLAAARTMPVSRPCDGCHDERAAAIDAAKQAITDARERVGYAKDAIDVLIEVDRQLALALLLIRRVLPDVGSVYEPVYDHVDAGRLMPKDGDFLTGDDGVTATTSAVRTAKPPAGTGADPCALR